MIAVVLYLTTLAPTISWGSDGKAVDGAELLTAANVLGIPHPPGYPTYTLLLKVFATLVQVGDYAFRGNLLSSLMATLTTVFLFLATVRLCKIIVPSPSTWILNVSSALAGITFATSPLFWSQSVVTEVYTLNTLFLSSMLFITTSIVLQSKSQITRESGTKLWIFSILLGLGMGNHITLILFAIPLIVWIGKTIGWRNMVSTKPLLALGIGLSTYLYLPIRSAQSPNINWGHAHTIHGLLWMLTAKPYQDYAFNIPIASLVPRITEWANLIFSQFNPLGIFVGLLGARRLFLQIQTFLLCSLVAMAVISIYAVTYSTIDFEVLMIPAFLLFSSWIGVGFFWISTSWIPNYSIRGLTHKSLNGLPSLTTALTILAFLMVPITSIVLNFDSQNMRNDRTAYIHSKSIMELVPEGSTIISNKEKNVFSLWYMSHVEMPERDIAVIAAPLMKYDWYLKDIHRSFPDRIPAMSDITFREALREIMSHTHGNSEVFFTFRNGDITRDYELEKLDKVYKAAIK